MPDQHTKPPKLLQAQLATFAGEYTKNGYDKSYVFSNIASIVTSTSDNVTRVTEPGDYFVEANGVCYELAAGTVRGVATKNEYRDFLRFVGGCSYEPIQDRASLLQAYEEFAPTVAELMAQLAGLRDEAGHQAYIGGGSTSSIFKIDHSNGSYAVRIPRDREEGSLVVDMHVAGAILAKGLPQMEQIVAASYEDGVTVAEIMPGKNMYYLTENEIDQITEVQLEALYDTLVAGVASGIRLDPNPANFMYDPKEGFGIVDYFSGNYAGSSMVIQDPRELVRYLAHILENSGNSLSMQGASRNPESKLKVVRSFGNIIERKLTGYELQEARQVIGIHTGRLQREALRDPAFVC